MPHLLATERMLLPSQPAGSWFSAGPGEGVEVGLIITPWSPSPGGLAKWFEPRHRCGPCAGSGAPRHQARQHPRWPRRARARGRLRPGEDLPGKRPSKTAFVALAERKMRGEIAPPPPGSDVLRWLHHTVVRGLAADPHKRYPLIAALERNPAQRRRPRMRFAVFAGVCAIAAVAVFALGWTHLRGHPSADLYAGHDPGGPWASRGSSTRRGTTGSRARQAPPLQPSSCSSSARSSASSAHSRSNRSARSSAVRSSSPSNSSLSL